MTVPPMVQESRPAGEIPAGELRRLAPPVLKLWLVSAVVWSLVVLAGALVAEWASRGAKVLPPGTIVAVALLVLATPAFVFSVLGYRRWGYAIRSHDVLVESGVVFRRRRSLPRSKVQHVDIQSGPVSRALGLVEVHLHTAGSLGPVATIPGLTPDAAEELRRSLVEESSDGV